MHKSVRFVTNLFSFDFTRDGFRELIYKFNYPRVFIRRGNFFYMILKLFF